MRNNGEFCRLQARRSAVSLLWNSRTAIVTRIPTKLDYISATAMAKGKKNTPTARKNNDTPTVHHTEAQRETKENKPGMEGDHACNTQSGVQSLRSPSKPRSPLSDTSSQLIQGPNDTDASHADTTKQKTDRPDKTDVNEAAADKKKTEDQTATTTTEPKHANMGSVAASKGPASTPQSKAAPGGTGKKKGKKSSQNKKVTDYFPIRRSNRRTKAELQSQEHRHIDDLIKNGTEDGLQVRHIEGKGRGVFAAAGFRKGDFVVEYHGDLLELAEAKEREAQYAQDPQTGCYMYYFQYHTKTYCVDATKETSRLGRLINHSKSGNCQTKLHPVGGTPHLILVASRDIQAQEELLYDYGDRSKASILAHPWLKH